MPTLDANPGKLYLRRSEAMKFLGVGKRAFRSLTHATQPGQRVPLRAVRVHERARALYATADLLNLRERLANTTTP